jgi:hypothetical protein
LHMDGMWDHQSASFQPPKGAVFVVSMYIHIHIYTQNNTRDTCPAGEGRVDELGGGVGRVEARRGGRSRRRWGGGFGVCLVSLVLYPILTAAFTSSSTREGPQGVCCV